MSDRALIRAGAAGIIAAAICCATPLLALLLPLTGLGAWLARADLVLLSLLVAGFGLIAWPSPPPRQSRLLRAGD
jgi:mercuric ion transport protein